MSNSPSNAVPMTQPEQVLENKLVAQLISLDYTRATVSDEASMLAGSMGMLPSASLGGEVGLYEPVHGSAPDIAGKGIANPIGAIASMAMLLRYSFDLEEESKLIEGGIESALANGIVTADLSDEPKSTAEVGDHVAQFVGGA